MNPVSRVTRVEVGGRCPSSPSNSPASLVDVGYRTRVPGTNPADLPVSEHLPDAPPHTFSGRLPFETAGPLRDNTNGFSH